MLWIFDGLNIENCYGDDTDKVRPYRGMLDFYRIPKQS